MGFLFSASKKEKLVAIFDIGSGSVGGALVKIPLTGKDLPVIIKSARTEITSRKDFDYNLFLKDMNIALNKTVTSLYNKKSGAPKEIICVLASPWYTSEVRTIKISKNSSFIFSYHLADELIKKEISNLNKSHKDKYDILKNMPVIIEQHITSVSLDGHLTSNPLNKRCKSCEMNMLISLAPQLCLEKIQDTLSKTFHHIPVTFSSFPLSAYLAVRDKYIDEDSYLLVDVSGEITDITVVIKGVLKSVLSFPFGKKVFLKHISSKLYIESRDAEELFKLYNDDNLSVELIRKLSPVLKFLEESWGQSFINCIKSLPNFLLFPSTVFLTADDDVKKLFSNVLRNEKNIQSLFSGHKCEVITLDGPEFLNMCGIQEGKCDPFLMTESIAIMRKMIK